MTCCAGWIQGGDVYIGADSLCGDSDGHIRTLKTKKVFCHYVAKDQVPLKMIFAVAGNVKLVNTMEHVLKVPDWYAGESIEQFI